MMALLGDPNVLNPEHEDAGPPVEGLSAMTFWRELPSRRPRGWRSHKRMSGNRCMHDDLVTLFWQVLHTWHCLSAPVMQRLHVQHHASQ